MSTTKPSYPLIPQALPPWQRVLHGVVLLIGWCIYFWFLYRVVKYSSKDLIDVGYFVLICFIVLPLTIYSWIIHNVNIFKRKGPRTNVRLANEVYEQDWLGTPVHLNIEDVRKASVVIIEITPQGKYFNSLDVLASSSKP